MGFQTGGVVVSSASCVNGVVYFGSSDGYIYAVNANTGKQIWDFQTAYRNISSPAVANGMVYTGADDGNIYCINAATGAKYGRPLQAESPTISYPFGYTNTQHFANVFTVWSMLALLTATCTL